MDKEYKHSNITPLDYLKFLIPSLIGIFLFMIPINVDGEVTIPVAILADWVQQLLDGKIPLIMTVIISLTVIFTLIGSIMKPAMIKDKPFLNSLFNVQPIWVIARILGMIFAIMTLYEIGPEYVWSGGTGGLLLQDLIPVLFSVFLFAGLFLPLLLNFGLLELFGTLLTKIMRPLFTLPGRSSIDCLASWLGDGTIGVLLTSKQYEQGNYSKREAAVIGTTFSVVSITFSIVVLKHMELDAYFVQYYLTIVVAGLVAALIMPRIPPLSNKKKTYINDSDIQKNEEIPEGMSMFSWGLKSAALTAKKTNSFDAVIKGGFKNVIEMWMAVIPIVMAIGTIALIIAENTPVFEWLGAPFVPLLQIMQVPEAAEAAQTMVVGFADMFLPALIGVEIIESEMTRFIIASLSVTQLIYMSEVGGLLLGSKIPVNFKDLVLIFIERTLITLPVIVLMAHILF
ncbi:YjiH family protein [Pseudalkalibacillus berkeleyi]|uniref:YjiH family protein n=1 Tax=Pseudalkalibacillus berkeleyi TaxID=1069813 RepID=A0ABS9GX57_9BACL|nr:YjiH family protein [Pseudalkalibacillus berkeleyi]MCF6137367.1 YjiH family protein [Pseudalkalibacillus berkeleyi]